MEILATSALTGQNLELLRAQLAAGRTYCFLGRSRVGKSSLVNALFGAEVVRTAGVRGPDRKGGHTTSSRDCRHGGEPGCAVREVLAEGSLDPLGYESYLEYLREGRTPPQRARRGRGPSTEGCSAPAYSRNRKGGYSSVMSAT